MKGVLIFVLLSFFLGTWASSCTDTCDTLNSATSSLYSGNITFCGTDGNTYNTFKAAVNAFTSPGCYAATCNIGLLYPGTCGCPNGCNANLGRGTCDAATDKCTCASGWGGKDCSNVACPNSCSGHGTCVVQNKKGDMCQCADGWTSADCSVPVPAGLANRLPFGQIFPGTYYQNDKYGDDQPVLNSSLVSTIRLTIDPADLNTMLYPPNMYNQTGVPADFFFFNSYTNEQIKGITVQLHGSLSRVFNKKSFNLKFGKGNNYKKLGGLTLKASNFDRIVIYQMMVDFHRSMMSQTYRMSFAELFVNQVYYGMYSMIEKINDDWEESRFNVTEDTDLFKMALYDAQDLGPTAEPYQNLMTPIYQTPQNSIEKEEGSDDSWDKFVAFVQGVNAPNPADRAAYLYEHFDLTAFLRSIALEAITMQFDGYAGTGNNWQIVDTTNDPAKSPYWSWIAFDFDSPLDGLNVFQEVIAQTYFHTNAATLNAMLDAGLYTLPNSIGDYFLSKNPYKFISRPEHPKPLLQAVFGLIGANQTYTNNIRAFLNAVWVKNKPALNQRFLDYYSLARTGISRDQFYTIDGSSVGLFDTAAGATLGVINNRFTYLQNLLGCPNTVSWQQTQQGSWNDGTTTYTQWSVTLRVGSEALYATQFSLVPPAGNTVQSAWSVDNLGNGVYALPTYVYQNGRLPAGSTFTFGYITTGSQQAAIAMSNEACSPPPSCDATVTTVKKGSWQSDALYQQYELTVSNNSPRPLANVNVKITLAAGSSISSSYNLVPVASAPNTYTCATYNLQSGHPLNPGCGYTVKTPQGSDANSYATVTLAQAVCV